MVPKSLMNLHTLPGKRVEDFSVRNGKAHSKWSILLLRNLKGQPCVLTEMPLSLMAVCCFLSLITKWKSRGHFIIKDGTATSVATERIFHFSESRQGRTWVHRPCLSRMFPWCVGLKGFSSRLWCWTWPRLLTHGLVLPSESVSFVIQFTFTREAVLHEGSVESLWRHRVFLS